MARVPEFLRSLAFALVCFGIACLLIVVVIWSHPSSALGSLSGMDAFYYMMEGKGDLHPIAILLIVLAISLTVLCVSSVHNAISVLFSSKGQSR